MAGSFRPADDAPSAMNHTDIAPTTADAAAAETVPPTGTPADNPTASAETTAEQEEALRQQRLRRVLDRIDAQPDFASTKDSMLGIQKISRSERSHVRALSDLILDDPAMVSKLLRLINAAFYKSAGGGQITSMQRAIALMGFRNIGLLASSLLMFERLPKGADGDGLRREFARAQLAAMLAYEFCHDRRYIDSIYIAALFHRLGQMLAGTYFRDELKAIEDQLDDRELAPGSDERQRACDQLARAQWGLTIEEIGIEVARQWGWPAALLDAMRAQPVADPEAEVERDAYARTLCTAANALAEQLMQLPQVGNAEERQEARRALVERFAAGHAIALSLDPELLPDRVERNKQHWDEMLVALNISLAATGGGGGVTAKAAPKLDPNSQQYRHALAERLADAVDRLRRLNQRSAPLTEVMDHALRLMCEALDLQRGIVCLRDADSGRLRGRLGVGDKATVLPGHFDIPLKPPGDLFGLLCARNADTLITDTSDPVIAQRLPPWFHQKVRAGAFVVLPMATDQAVMGMLYGDQQERHRLHVHPRALTLLKNLRNEVLRAMKVPVPYN